MEKPKEEGGAGAGRGRGSPGRGAGAQRPRASRGVPVAWVLVSAGVAGLLLGVGLSLQRQAKLDEELEHMGARAVTATPTGAPMWVPDPRRVDAGDPFAPDPASIRGIPDYPNAKPRGMVAPPRVQGVPMALSWFETGDSVRDVVQFYDEYFRLAGILRVSRVFHDGLGYSGWLEEDPSPDAGFGAGVMHMVSAFRNGDRTLVVFSATNPRAILDAQAPELPPGLALPPQATRPQVLELGEIPGARLAVHAAVPGGKLAEVVAFYERSLAAGGWSVTERTREGESSASFTASRGDTLQTVSLDARPEGVAVFLNAQRQ